jgi:hypothetical protein
MNRQRFASKRGVRQPPLFQLGFGKVGEEGRGPLPDCVSQEPNQPGVQKPKMDPGRPRQEGSTDREGESLTTVMTSLRLSRRCSLACLVLLQWYTLRGKEIRDILDCFAYECVVCRFALSPKVDMHSTLWE